MKIAVTILRLYKKIISPHLQKIFGNACRFTPTCAEYTITALEKHGLVEGIRLGAKRLIKCHPWGGFGYDPVPAKH